MELVIEAFILGVVVLALIINELERKLKLERLKKAKKYHLEETFGHEMTLKADEPEKELQ